MNVQHLPEAAKKDQHKLDLMYCVTQTPLGELLLVVSPQGLMRVAYPREGFDAVIETLERRLHAKIQQAPEKFARIRQELEEYFYGSRLVFDHPLDFRLATAFGHLVQKRLMAIAYGSTRTYRQIAEELGQPQAARAVGNACASNPIPIVVPCHRVVRSGKGQLGGYLAGLEVKRELLELEERVSATHPHGLVQRSL